MWKDGRKLATLTKGSTSVSYKYNSDGIRYEKTVNGVVHKYYLMGSTITAETIIDGTNTTHIEYFYDSYGPYGFSINGTFYYYVKNLQGDVTQIRDENNGLVASYVYDAWGKVLSTTEYTTNSIGAKNAIRYRGYYYDTESNLYYLNARYYDPQIKRFISTDGILGSNPDMFGYNLYIYCGNNPVVRADYNGEWWVVVIVAIVVGCISLTGCSSNNDYFHSKDNIKYTSDQFNSEEEAAIAALRYICSLPDANKKEYAANIYYCSAMEKYYYGEIQEGFEYNGRECSVTYDLKYGIPNYDCMGKSIAHVHNHPMTVQIASHADKTLIIQNEIPEYIGIMKENIIRRINIYGTIEDNFYAVIDEKKPHHLASRVRTYNFSRPRFQSFVLH